VSSLAEKVRQWKRSGGVLVGSRRSGPLEEFAEGEKSDRKEKRRAKTQQKEQWGDGGQEEEEILPDEKEYPEGEGDDQER
jgi:hypothetical protein